MVGRPGAPRAKDDAIVAADLPAGGFAAWLRDMQAALRGERDADVPCGRCTACCRSSQFVHIGPDESDALAHIPREVLFPAPRMPGYLVLPYDEHGCCPMLTDDGCSIYEHRPRACRTYDCRVFSAAGIAPDEGKELVAERVLRWRFDFTTDDDHTALAAVRTAVRADEGDAVNATERAVRAVARASA